MSSAGPVTFGVAQPPSSAVRPKVLIVDRDSGWVRALATELALHGFTSVGAYDGLDALHALDRDQPNLILLELDVPVISGFRLLHLFKQRGAAPDTPVIVLTSFSFQEAYEAVRAGADGFLQKPLLPEQVTHRVQQMLVGSGVARTG